MRRRAGSNFTARGLRRFGPATGDVAFGGRPGGLCGAVAFAAPPGQFLADAGQVPGQAVPVAFRGPGRLGGLRPHQARYGPPGIFI
ncbi:MAG: hypothetical protein ABSF03_09485 [Streptosporangiaceae bacterium]